MDESETVKDIRASKILTTKVHGYKQTVVSNFLKDRYPYQDSINPNKENIDKSEISLPNFATEIHKSVFFRRIPNLISILQNSDNSEKIIQEALMILNETVSIQEEKIKMIDANLIEITFGMLDEFDSAICKEILSLLGSLLSVREGRKRLSKLDLKKIRRLLSDEDIGIRNNLGWMLMRIASGRDGVEQLVEQNVVKWLIPSLRKFGISPLSLDRTTFVVYLLQTIFEILNDESYTYLFTNQDFVEIINGLLREISKSEYCFGKKTEEIGLLCLDCLSLFTVDNQGKNEAVALRSIEAVEGFLENKNTIVVNSAIRVLMFIAIHPDGRRDIIDYKDRLLLKRFKKLVLIIDNNIRDNMQELIITLSEDGLRFKTIFNSLEEESN